MNNVDSRDGTIAISPQHQLDEAQLFAWMTANIAGFAGPLEILRFKGGQSNPTYRLTTPGREYVLRRKPPGHLVKGAHAIEREARVLEALGKTGFPVPRVLGLCTDDAVIGSWFYVMELVVGRIFWDAGFADVASENRHLYQDAMNLTLARLHTVNPGEAGLGDFGRPAQYVDRQIARWSKQYLEDELAGRNADMDFLVQWLPRNSPASEEYSVVHGDFRVDNMIFHPTEPRVMAVLDWELSTLGHPLADFAYHLMMYRVPPEIVGGIKGLDLTAAALMSEAEYVTAYCERTGRAEIKDLDFYVAFNMFRFAAILHGIRGRLARGTAASADAEAMSSRFEQVASTAAAEAKALDRKRINS